MSADDMKALVWEGPGVVAVHEVAWPAAGAGQALVDVAYAGICGTDLHIVAGTHPRAKPGLVMGHELVGWLVDPAGGLPAGVPVLVNPLLSCGECRAFRT